MKDFIFQAGNDWTGFILRLTLGFILFPHGAQKLLGWWGGYGFKGTMGYFTETVGLPWIIGLAIILLEVFGALLLIAGFGTRIWALGTIGLMIGIIITSHISNGFFMNWNGTMQGEGYEFHLLYIGAALALLINGAGKFSLDQLI
ncbi:MAG: DoxX family protein [Saprospiraceae bacterium]